MWLEKKTCAQHAIKIKNLTTHDNYYLLQHMKTILFFWNAYQKEVAKQQQNSKNKHLKVAHNNNTFHSKWSPTCSMSSQESSRKIATKKKKEKFNVHNFIIEIEMVGSQCLMWTQCWNFVKI
jgi:hypothetical protein